MNNKNIVRWCRIIHRDLGYLMVGLCLVYALSGILLNHMKGEDPAFTTQKGTLLLSPGLSNDELTVAWGKQKELPGVKKILPLNEERVRVLCESGLGEYRILTGEVIYEIYHKRPFVYWINKMHYNQLKGWSLVADLFAIALIFFALSGLVMVRGKNGLAGRGKWYLLAGILIPVLYAFFSA